VEGGTVSPVYVRMASTEAVEPPGDASQRDRLAVVRAKYASRLCAGASQMEENHTRQPQHATSRNAVRALLCQREQQNGALEDHDENGDSCGPSSYRQDSISPSASRERILACLSNPSRVQIVKALEASFSRCEAAASNMASLHGTAADSIAPDATANVTRLVRILRERRDTSEAAAVETMRHISQLMEEAHLDDARLQLGSVSQHSTMLERFENSISRQLALSETPSAETASHCIKSQLTPQVSARSGHGDMHRGAAPRSGTAIDVVVTVPHLLQYGLFFPTMDSVTVCSYARHSTEMAQTSSPRVAGSIGSTPIVAATVEEVMCMTARQLALRILFAAWTSVLKPAGALLQEYEENFSLSQVSTWGLRSELYKWGVVHKDDKSDAMADDNVGFHRMSELYDSGAFQVVVSGSSLIPSSVQGAYGVDIPHDPFSDKDGPAALDGNATTAAADDNSSGDISSVRIRNGVVLRHETPLAGCTLFRRWASVTRSMHLLGRGGDDHSDARSVLPSFMCYVFETRPGTLDTVHLKNQFAELVA
jgi:DNA-binding transcriptional ArsR family regulator